MIAAAKVTSKGQVTIPKMVRERMRLKAGDKIEFVTEKDGTTLRLVRSKENPFKKYVGMYRGAFKNREEINAWVADMRDPK